MIEKIGARIDALGAAASWLCVIHCLGLPFLIGVLPLVGLSFLLDETTDLIFILFSALLAALSLVPAYFRDHGKLRAIFLASAGIGLIALTHLLFEKSLIAKIVFLIVGAGLLSGAHLVNRRLCLECAKCRTL